MKDDEVGGERDSGDHEEPQALIGDVAALAAETRARELIVPLLLLPLLVPLLIACAQATEPLMRQDAGPEDLGRWLSVLTLYDVVFVLLSIAVFDFLLED